MIHAHIKLIFAIEGCVSTLSKVQFNVLLYLEFNCLLLRGYERQIHVK